MSFTFLKNALLLAAVVAGAGCHFVKITEPKRSATEQLLLSTAADRAVREVDLSSLKGKKVYVEEEYFKSYDEGYALGAIRQHLSESGALLTQSRTNAEIVVEVRSGGLGLDLRESLLGIPAMTLPVPLAGAAQTPELALYKSLKGDSIAKFALFAYERVSGAHVHSTEAMSGGAHFHHYKILGFINWRRTSVPELDPKIGSRLKREK
jgi:hypothetical protein